MLDTNKQKGISLYFTLIILSVLTSTLLGALAISLSQTRIVFGLGNSVTAFYAADTGSEEVLYEIFQGSFDATTESCDPLFADPSGTLTDANYEVCVYDYDGATKVSTLQSTGFHTASQTSRRIELRLKLQ